MVGHISIGTTVILLLITCGPSIYASGGVYKLQNGPDAAIPIDFSYNGEHRLSALLGVSLPDVIGSGVDCSPFEDPNTTCRSYGDFANVTIVTDGNCANVEWTSTYARRLEDCFNVGPDDYMYGGPESLQQYWPINTDPKNEAAYVTSDFLTRYNDFGNLIENYWLFSKGAVIHVDEENPLFLSYNTTRPEQLCLISANKHPYTLRPVLTLKYTVCVGSNVKTVHQDNFPKWYKKPTGLPDETMLIRPLWSTWAQYGPSVDQSKVVDLARNVISNGFELSSHIEIDDKWETCYGQLEFDPQKFPDPSGMVDEIKALNLRVTLWVHPFINFDCELFSTGLRNGYFLKDQHDKTAIAGWWAGGRAGAIDVTNETSTDWWRNRLESLRTTYGIDSFKFDAGEVNWLPYSLNLEGNQNLSPNLYGTKYVDAIATFGGLIETRVGRLSQEHPIFTRIMDRDSHWRHDAGIKSVIPTVLLFGVLGYPFILPDMIGGSGEPSNPWPSKELYLRWVQLNVFMPAMQFSMFPWDDHLDDEVRLTERFIMQGPQYSNQMSSVPFRSLSLQVDGFFEFLFSAKGTTVDIVKRLLNLREEFKDVILDAANQAVRDGSPINRPIWWVDPTDPETFTIDQAYMLGDTILVAPVVEEGATSRDIYLPVGTWLSGTTNVTHIGPIWLRGYDAPIDVLPHFIKL